ncbi:AT1B4 protein, partial [Polypterus senegalus]
MFPGDGSSPARCDPSLHFPFGWPPALQSGEVLIASLYSSGALSMRLPLHLGDVRSHHELKISHKVNSKRNITVVFLDRLTFNGKMFEGDETFVEGVDIQPENTIEQNQEPSTEEESDEEMYEDKMPRKTWGEVMSDLKMFCWNPETGEFMGRSAKSWGPVFIIHITQINSVSPGCDSPSYAAMVHYAVKNVNGIQGLKPGEEEEGRMPYKTEYALIILFYLVLYAFLAAMFSVCMYALLLTISPYKPTYRERVVPPGVMISPCVEGFDIAFNASDSESWKKYKEALDYYLNPFCFAAYDDDIQEKKNLLCNGENYIMRDGAEDAVRTACQFKRSLLGNCSGIVDPSFGYSEGKPCILMKMNRIVGYLPGDGTAVSVSCEVQKGEQEDLGPPSFYPSNSFSLKYYPYYGKLVHVNYTSPLVAIQFAEVKKDVLLTVQCKLNGSGIINDSPHDRFLGRITFTLLVGA